MANDDDWNNSSSLTSFINHNYSSATLVAKHLLLGSGVHNANAIGGQGDARLGGDGAGTVVATDADNMESWMYTVAAVVLAINGFFGFTLNISVIVLMCKDMQVRFYGLFSIQLTFFGPSNSIANTLPKSFYIRTFLFVKKPLLSNHMRI